MFLWPFLASDLNFRAMKYLVVLDLKQVLFIICFNRNFKINKKYSLDLNEDLIQLNMLN